jgi:hypothetical protein
MAREFDAHVPISRLMMTSTNVVVGIILQLTGNS